MQTIRITTAQNIDIDYEIGGLGERIVARIIDLAIFGVVFAGTALFGISINFADATGVILLIIYACLFGFYDLLCEIFMQGQSVGKKVMKLRVISADGAQPRIGQYFMRWIMRLVDFIVGGGAIALVAAAVTDKSQRLGDFLANTIVVRTEARANSQHIAFKPADDGYEPVFNEALQLSEQDVELINEVITTYIKTGNSMVVFNLAQRIKQHLNVTPPEGMNDMRFLQTLLKDYAHLVAAQAESF